MVVNEKSIRLVNKVLNEGRYEDKKIEKAQVSVEYDLENAIKNKDIKTVKKLAGKYENALKYIEKAREKKKAPNGRYWELPEWIIAILFGLSAVGIAGVSYLSSKKTKFSKEDLDKMQNAISKALNRCYKFIDEQENTTHEAAMNLIEQVLYEGRYHDRTIQKTQDMTEVDLDNAIVNEDLKKVKKLRDKYIKALNYIKEARTKEKAPGGKYWALPQWLLFLLAPWPISIPLISYTSSEKTKFTDQDLDKIEKVLKEAVRKCDNFIDSKE